MSGCLACKSCTAQCPVKVDVPGFRAKFLHLYHGRYLRPLKDYLIGNLENLLPLLANPIGRRLYNGLISSPLASRFLRQAGMVDSPLIHRRSPANVAKALGIQRADEHALQNLGPEEKARSVVIVQDAFTRFFETDTFASVLECLQKLGFKVWLMPYRPNGKPLHVQGFLKQFTAVANRRQQELEKLSRHGIPLVGIEPSMTLAYRSEYPKYVRGQVAEVLLLQEFLGQRLDYLIARKPSLRPESAKMMGHCTEKTNAPASMQEWARIFSALGQSVTQEPVGCCGMAGTYGHETRNRETSEKIYDLSWRDKIASAGQTAIIATGYSCRSQASRLQQQRLLHPLEFLLSQMEAGPKITT